MTASEHLVTAKRIIDFSDMWCKGNLGHETGFTEVGLYKTEKNAIQSYGFEITKTHFIDSNIDSDFFKRDTHINGFLDIQNLPSIEICLDNHRLNLTELEEESSPFGFQLKLPAKKAHIIDEVNEENVIPFEIGTSLPGGSIGISVDYSMIESLDPREKSFLPSFQPGIPKKIERTTDKINEDKSQERLIPFGVQNSFILNPPLALNPVEDDFDKHHAKPIVSRESSQFTNQASSKDPKVFSLFGYEAPQSIDEMAVCKALSENHKSISDVRSRQITSLINMTHEMVKSPITSGLREKNIKLSLEIIREELRERAKLDGQFIESFGRITRGKTNHNNIRMEFYAPVTNAVGNVERDQYIDVGYTSIT
ncbi:MAG: hypothetical protein AAGG51_24725 [Cyanobacteria bacterium P01_G01_bin.54]